MKKILSTALTAAILITSLISCSQASKPTYSKMITASSSDAEEYALWLDSRLGDRLTEKVTLGTAEESGISMDTFEDDGYIIRHDGDEVLLLGKTGEGLDLAVRKYAKYTHRGEKVEDTVYHEGYRIGKLLIADRDISEYVIELGEDANDNVKFASRELSRLINVACGVEIPVSEGISDRKCAFEFRYSDREDFFTEGFSYRIEGNRVIFDIAPERGAKNAVWYFVQEELGWECLTYGEPILHEADEINVPATASAERTPAFEYLQSSYTLSNTSERSGMYGFGMDRGLPQTVAENSGQEIGAHYRYGQYRHANHGMERNEWGGVVYSHWRQMCYTDESNLDNIVSDVLNYLSSCTENDVTDLVDISQGDNMVYCKCNECMNVFKEEGNANSGAVIRFTNEVARQVNEEYPDVVFLIYAYHGTNKPPKTAPTDNVLVTYCLDGNCSAHPLCGSECDGISIAGYVDRNGYNNKDYAQWLIDWCKLSPNIYVWYYQLNLGFNMSSYYTNIYKDFNYMKDSGICGLYANCHTDNFDIQRVYNKLWTELYWNGEMTEEEYRATWELYLQQEYGDNWQAIDEYIGLLERAQRMRKGCWNCWGYDDPKCEEYFHFETLGSYFDRIIELFDEALLGCNTRLQEKLTYRLAACAYYKCIYVRSSIAFECGDEAELAYLAEKYDEMVELLKKADFDIKDYKDYADNYEDAVTELWGMK